MFALFCSVVTVNQFLLLRFCIIFLLVSCGLVLYVFDI